jgi:hypothetical protein
MRKKDVPLRRYDDWTPKIVGRLQDLVDWTGSSSSARAHRPECDCGDRTPMAILNIVLTLTKSLGYLIQIECVYPLKLTTPSIAIDSVREPSFPELLAYATISPVFPARACSSPVLTRCYFPVKGSVHSDLDVPWYTWFASE